MALQSRNQLALVVLVVGKLLGIVGLFLGATSHRTMAGLLLVIDAVFIATAVGLCLRTMSLRAKEDAGQKQVLAQMVREGTLKQFLREVESEAKA